jgi:hypothetical protein
MLRNDKRRPVHVAPKGTFEAQTCPSLGDCWICCRLRVEYRWQALRPPDIQTLNNQIEPRNYLYEQEISDVRLGTFYVKRKLEHSDVA